jgi:hypothetical protein
VSVLLEKKKKKKKKSAAIWNILSIVNYLLSLVQQKIPINTIAHSEYVIVIVSGFKLGSVGRSVEH